MDSPKRLDLVRDGRYMLHLLPGAQEEEFWIRGVATRVTDEGTRARVVDAGGEDTRIRPEEWLFEYDVRAAGTTAWLDFGGENHRPSRRLWRSAARV